MPLSIGTNLKDTAHDVLSFDRRPETVWKVNKRPRGIPQDIQDTPGYLSTTSGRHLWWTSYSSQLFQFTVMGILIHRTQFSMHLFFLICF